MRERSDDVQDPPGVAVGERLGGTDRGALYRAVDESGQDRIVRFVDQELATDRFKDALAVLAGREWPRMAPIVGHGYGGRHYHVVYAVGARCETLEERLAAAPDWRSRLLLSRQVCDVFPQWADGPVRPLGITVRDVVLTLTGNGRHPWLLPCPPVHVPSPGDLLDVDPDVLATVPPEAIRGVHADPAARDAYALGTLAAQAAGCGPAGPGAGDVVTGQARNALLRPSARASAIPSYLAAAPPVDALFRAIDRHRHREPGVRPVDAGGLARAVREVTDVPALADALDDPAHAREVLCLLRPEEGGEFVRGVLRAAGISADAGDPDRALALIDDVVRHYPGARSALRLRADVLWRLVEPAESLDPADPLVRRTVEALGAVKDDPSARTEPYRRAGQVHLRCGDVAAAADEFYEAAERDKTDLTSLWRYQDCWRRLGDDRNAAAVGQEGRRRAARMVHAGMMSEGDGRSWHDLFG